MPASFLKRHRTICNVLEEIRLRGMETDKGMEISALVTEAKDYAERMSRKLVEYKREKAKWHTD